MTEFKKTLKLDTENVTAHYGLSLLHKELCNEAQADEHQKVHDKYRPGDQARGIAVRKTREKYPAANRAAESLVIYPLHRSDALELGKSVESVGAEE